MEKYNQILDLVKAMEADFQKFYEKGQSAAGTRLRKALNDLRKVSQDLRMEIQKTKTERKESK